MATAMSYVDVPSTSYDTQFIISRSGNVHIMVDGFTYRKDKVYRDTSYWVCTARGRHNCRSRLHVAEDNAETPTILRQIEFHNHDVHDTPLPPKPELEFKMEKKALETSDTIGHIVESVLTEEPATLTKSHQKKMISTLRRGRSENFQSSTETPGVHCLSPDQISSARYVSSYRGTRNIAVGGYIYRRQKVTGNKSYWICSLGKKWNCKSKLHVLETDSEKPTILNGRKFHNHPPDVEYVERHFTTKKWTKKKPVNNFQTTPEKSQGSKVHLNDVPTTLSNSLNDTSLSSEGMEVVLNHSSEPVIEQRMQLRVDAAADNEVSQNTQIEVRCNEQLEPPTRRPRKIYTGPLEEKTILITGATNEVGMALSKTLAEAGASVCLTSDSYNKLWTLRQEIEVTGGDAHEFLLNVADREQFSAVVEAIEERLGPIDVLINNASIMCQKNMQDAKAEDWDKMIDVNIRGVTNSIACVLPQMIQCREGCIVNISSKSGRRPQPGMAVYSGSKFFVEGMSQALREEVKDKGVQVICVRLEDCGTATNDASRSNDVLQKNATAAGPRRRSLDCDRVAQTVMYALTQPPHISLNEISIEACEMPRS